MLQGNVGDCYFLASISSLAEDQQRIYDIFDNELAISNFGIYRINANFRGQPQQIIIDDYIPVYADNVKKTIFSRPHNNEIWVLLLEKAWAKICGSYGNTSAGNPH